MVNEEDEHKPVAVGCEDCITLSVLSAPLNLTGTFTRNKLSAVVSASCTIRQASKPKHSNNRMHDHIDFVPTVQGEYR